jgi:hypothetical protein
MSIFDRIQTLGLIAQIFIIPTFIYIISIDKRLVRIETFCKRCTDK